MELTVKPVGDCALSAAFDGPICLQTNLQVRALQCNLEQLQLPGIEELVCAYCSLMIHYDPLQISYAELEETVLRLSQHLHDAAAACTTVTQIPVLYGGQWGPDLEEVAKLENISPQEVIRRHTGSIGFIYMIAFAPGLPYIGSAEQTFSVPRRATPREKLPAGAVTIWQSQTTVFPVELPGGWNVIGQTPLQLFDKDAQESPFLLKAGSWVEFVSIDEATYNKIEAQVKEGTYRPVTYEKGDA